MARRLVALLVLATLLGACTTADDPQDGGAASPSPSPSGSPPDSGDRVAVVVGPSPTVPPGERAAQLAAAEALADLPDVSELRVVEATSLGFVEDLALVLADDGFDLVCVVGTGTADRVERVARERPLTRFCSTDPLAHDPPTNLVVVGLDLSAVAAVAGAALGVPGGPVGLLASPTTGELEPLALALAEQLPPLPSPAPSGTPVPTASPSPPAASAAPTTAPTPVPPPPPRPRVLPLAAPTREGQARGLVDDVRGSGAAALVALGGRTDSAVATAADAATPVVGIADWLVDAEGQLPASVLLAVVVDRRAVLLAAATAARSSPGAAPALLGIEQGVLEVLPGTLAASEAAAERALALLQRTVG